MNNNIKDTTSLVFVRGKNLFNKNAVLKNYELTNNGADVGYNDLWFVSDYIEVEPNTIYYLSGNKTGGTTNAFYDENKTYISYVSKTTGDITTPSNAKYMRFNCRLSEIDNNIMFEQNSTATTYEPYINKQIQIKNKNGVFEEFYNEGKSVTKKIKNSNGTAVLFDDGTMICYGNVYSTNISWSTWGSIYSSTMSYTFPLGFVTFPVVICSVAGGVGTGNGWTGRPSHTTTGGTVEIYRSTTYGNTMSIDYIAIGNWK